MLEGLRGAIGKSRKIRIDVNQAWTIPQAARMLRHWHDRFLVHGLSLRAGVGQLIHREAY